MAWLAEIKLRAEHSLIIGNAPDSIPLKTVVSKHAKGMDLLSMGLFDTAAPNFSSYYPGVSAEDLKPKDSEFIEPIYRALSEVIVHKNWNPVDFSENQVLKKSISLLKGQTVYPNHEAIVGNELGAVADVDWEESYKIGEIVIPAGMNARLKIDGKANPKIARAIQMNPPAVHSTSVTVQFLWEKSHAEMSEEDFWRKLGSFDAEGKMIRRIATKILRYNEISLVSKGADPYAQKIDEKGNINNPKEAKVRDTGKLKEQKYFTFSFVDVLSNGDENITIPEEYNDNTSLNNQSGMKQYLLALAAIMALKMENGESYTESTITEDIIKNAITGIKAKADTQVSLVAAGATTVEEVTRLKNVETEYNKIKDKPIAKLEQFETTIVKELRDLTISNHTKLMDGKPQEAIVTMLNAAGYEVLKGLNVQYEQQLEEKFKLTCSDCGSHSVTRGSATKPQTADESNNSDKGGKKTESLEDIIYKKQNEKSIGLFQEAE